MSWRIQSLRKKGAQFCPDDFSGSCTADNAKFYHKNIDFPSYKVAADFLVQRLRKYGGLPLDYIILEFMSPTLSANPSIPFGNTHCGTCREPFPYDPLPANRPDGKTDCYQCKTLISVFRS